jgi:hypothetical protein
MGGRAQLNVAAGAGSIVFLAMVVEVRAVPLPQIGGSFLVVLWLVAMLVLADRLKETALLGDMVDSSLPSQAGGVDQRLVCLALV